MANGFRIQDSGSSSDQPISVDKESSLYPAIKAYHRPAPDDRLASKNSHVEQKNSFSKEFKRSNRADDVECRCAFCCLTFKSRNITQMRVHLRGESQGTIRVGACKNVLLLAKNFIERSENVKLPNHGRKRLLALHFTTKQRN